MKGLIIKPYWADEIFDGNKDLEIRGSWTNHRGVFSIIKSGTGMVYGTAELTDVQEIYRFEFDSYKHRHGVNSIEDVTYKRIFGWSIHKAIRYPEPIPYKHPQGAVIWVNL